MDYPENRLATRLNSFRTQRQGSAGVAAAIRTISRIPGIDALELNYPQHFGNPGEPDPFEVAQECELAITALNLRFDGQEFALGAFTNPDQRVREHAIAIAIEAVDLAAGNDVEHVILWMGPDGFDYPFQVEFAVLWNLEIEGFRRVASRNSSIRVSVEYKPSDPRRVSLIRSMSDSLLAAAEVNLPNFGVTIDFCHSLMAGEQPAAAAALASRSNRLFGVHLNDGYGPADDGLMVGAVHERQTLELLWVLQQYNFRGTIYFDTFPERIDAAAECAANVSTIRSMQRMLRSLPHAEMRSAQQGHDAARASALIRSCVDRAADG